MVDPGFPKGGQPIVLVCFPKNCMKLKKNWTERGGVSLSNRHHLDPKENHHFYEEF